MTDTQRPWDRRADESDPAFEAFALYLETGSLRDAYRQRSGKAQATAAPGAWTGWSTKHHWVSRRAAYVEWTVRECQDAIQVGLVQIRRRFIDTANTLLDASGLPSIRTASRVHERRRRGWSGLRVSRRMSRHVRATVAVAVLTLAVLGPPVQAQDTPSAQELADLRALAEAGTIEAQYSLGVKYDTGEGVPQDDAEAVRWYRLSAEQGHAGAQYSTSGVCVRHRSRACRSMMSEAVIWYRRAAEQGHAGAQFNLGVRLR